MSEFCILLMCNILLKDIYENDCFGVFGGLFNVVLWKKVDVVYKGEIFVWIVGFCYMFLVELEEEVVLK